MIITDGNRTLVDHTDYNLSIEEAAIKLLTGRNIIAQSFPDYLSGESIEDQYPESEELKAEQFAGQTYEEIVKYLSMYYQFGSI